MPNADRRALAQSYKNRLSKGGVCRVVHRASGWAGTPRATSNIDGERNKLILDKTSGSTSDIEMLEVWKRFSGEGFELEVLDELDQKPGQSAQEYRDDLKTLLDIRRSALDHP